MNSITHLERKYVDSGPVTQSSREKAERNNSTKIAKSYEKTLKSLLENLQSTVSSKDHCFINSRFLKRYFSELKVEKLRVSTKCSECGNKLPKKSYQICAIKHTTGDAEGFEVYVCRKCLIKAISSLENAISYLNGELSESEADISTIRRTALYSEDEWRAMLFNYNKEQMKIVSLYRTCKTSRTRQKIEGYMMKNLFIANDIVRHRKDRACRRCHRNIKAGSYALKASKITPPINQREFSQESWVICEHCMAPLMVKAQWIAGEVEREESFLKSAENYSPSRQA